MGSLIRKGVKAAMSGSNLGGKFLRLTADVPEDVVMLHGLNEVQTVDQHDFWDYNPAPHLVCLGDETCPGCRLGNEAKPKSYIAIITKNKEVKYLPVGASIIGQLEKFEKAVGDLTGKVIRFERNGTGMKTRYSAIMLGKKLDVSGFEAPDLEELLTPLDIAGQMAKLTEAGIDVSEMSEVAVKAEPKAKTAKVKKAPAKEPKDEGKTAEPTIDAPWEDDESDDGDSGWASL